MPENVHIQAMTLGQLEAEVLRLCWIQFNENSDGSPPASAYYKYSQYRVRQKINEAYSKLAGMVGYLQSWFIVTLKKDYSQYQMPLNVVDVTEVLYFTSATSYEKLKIRTMELIEDELPGWRTDTGTPEYAYPSDWNKMNRLLGVAPAPSADGTAITLDSSVLNRYAPYGAVEGVEGSANVDSATSTYVDSSGQDFGDLGVVPGHVILNITDGSRGTITSITTTNSTNDTIACSGGLSGGSTNVWTAGHEMKIIGGTYAPIVTATGTETTYLVGANPGVLWEPTVTMAAGNLFVTCLILPTLLRTSRQYPELHPLFHGMIAREAAGNLCQQEPTSSPEFAQGQSYIEDVRTGVASVIDRIRGDFTHIDMQIIGYDNRRK